MKGASNAGADPHAAFGTVWHELIAPIEGESWKKSTATIATLRKTLGAGFLVK
jgi:hypothetical protein